MWVLLRLLLTNKENLHKNVHSINCYLFEVPEGEIPDPSVDGGHERGSRPRHEVDDFGVRGLLLPLLHVTTLANIFFIENPPRWMKESAKNSVEIKLLNKTIIRRSPIFHLMTALKTPFTYFPIGKNFLSTAHRKKHSSCICVCVTFEACFLYKNGFSVTLAPAWKKPSYLCWWGGGIGGLLHDDGNALVQRVQDVVSGIRLPKQ